MSACAWLTWFATGELIDDAYINFRYGRNWIDGHGVVFNQGERVEGYTSIAWLGLVTMAMWVGVPATYASRILGAAFFLGTLVCLNAFARREDSSALRRWTPLALLASSPIAALWAVHGLETTLFGLFILAGTMIDLGSRRRRAVATSSTLLGVATLTRPEGAAVFLFHLAIRLWFTPRSRRLEGMVLRTTCFLAVVAPHVAWRWLYYGDLVPNTAHAKIGASAITLGRGLDYLGDFFLAPSGLLFLFALVALRGRRERSVTIAASVLALMAAIILEGGDGFPGFRFLAPALPLLYLLVGEGLAIASPAVSRRVLVCAGIPVLALHLLSSGAAAAVERAEANVVTSRMRLVGERLAEVLPPGTTVAANPIGAIGFHCNCRILDMLGLTDRHIARSAADDFGRGQAGHEKGDGSYVFARRPELILFGNVLVSRPGAPKEIGLREPWTAVHRSERGLAAIPELDSVYERDVLDLPEDRHLLFLRRRDFTLSTRSDGIAPTREMLLDDSPTHP